MNEVKMQILSFGTIVITLKYLLSHHPCICVVLSMCVGEGEKERKKDESNRVNSLNKHRVQLSADR